MTKYLFSFPSAAMQVAPEELPAVSDAARAVTREARAAGVYVFAGGLDDGVAPVRVAADGAVTPGSYPQTERLDGGFMVLELPSRDAALAWAARIATACRCPQEVRAFGEDPEV